MSRTVKKPRRNLRSEYGMACPKCRQADRLTLRIRCSANLTIDGTEAFGDHCWEDTDFCICDECGFEATVAEFRVADRKAVQA